MIVGGKGLEHNYGVHRGIGYFMPLILLAIFARSPLSIRLRGDDRFLVLFLLQPLGVCV